MEWFPECRDGGLDRYFYEELQTLAETGVSGTALVSSCNPAIIGNVAIRAMAAEKASLLQRWKGARSQAKAALLEGVDAVNAHFALYAFPWLDLIPRDVPLVVNFQGPWADEIRAESNSLKRRAMAMVAQQIERRVYQRADRIITLSAAFRDLVHQRYGVPLQRVRVIPGALHLEPWLKAPAKSEARRRLQLPAERPILVSVRRLARRMGLELMIDAIADVRKTHPEVLLLIGGKGPEAERLKNRVAALHLDQNVRMLGFIPESDLPTFYAAADFSVVPTVSLEGFGLITAESLASGTPVLGTRVGATPEILEPLDPALLFDEVSSAAMATKIKTVLRREVALPGSAACRAYAQQYGWPSVAPKIIRIFEEAIEECRGR